jgi:predicted SnoaL-like aldol condensation-catalyzing enzyme
MAHGTKESTIIATIRSREIYFIHSPSDAKTGETRTRAGMQVYRIEGGKFAETWLMFQEPRSAWPDAVAQEHWMSPPPVK